MLFASRSPNHLRLPLGVLGSGLLLVAIGCSRGEGEPAAQTTTGVPQPSAEELAKLREQYLPPSPLSTLLRPPATSPEQEWTLKATAADALSRIGRPAVPALMEALTAADAETRYQAARALSRMGPAAEEAIPALVRALDDPDPRVRRMAARALGQIGPKAAPALPALVQVLYEPEPEAAEQAIAGRASGAASGDESADRRGP